MKLRIKLVLVAVTVLLMDVATADNWRTLTAPQPLPKAENQGSTEVKGADIHYKIYGSENHKTVALIHGGLGASEDFGGQISALSEVYRVVAIDSRGHARSSEGDVPITYHQMALDVLAVMDNLRIASATIVGWSDGGVLGLELGVNFPERVDGLFLIGTYYMASGSRSTIARDDLANAYMEHAEKQYRAISSTPDNYKEFSEKLYPMWQAGPNLSDQQLMSISMPTIIAHGVYDEFINENHARRMAELIPGAEFWLIDNASHFVMWQQPEVVNAAILEFMKSLQ